MTIAGGPDLITDGLVLHLDAANSKSYAGAGTLWTDLSGSNKNGTLTNSPTYNTRNGGGIVFNGTNQYVSCPSVLNFGGASSVGTIIIAAKGSGEIISNQRTNTNHGWIQTTVSNTALNLYIDAYGGSPYGESFSASFSNTKYTVNNWNFYSMVINRPANSYTIGINDYFVDYTRSFTVDSPQNFNTVEIARMNNFSFYTTYFTGSVSNVAIYNRALTKNEVLQNYYALKGRYGL